MFHIIRFFSPRSLSSARPADRACFARCTRSLDGKNQQRRGRRPTYLSWFFSFRFPFAELHIFCSTFLNYYIIIKPAYIIIIVYFHARYTPVNAVQGSRIHLRWSTKRDRSLKVIHCCSASRYCVCLQLYYNILLYRAEVRSLNGRLANIKLGTLRRWERSAPYQQQAYYNYYRGFIFSIIYFSFFITSFPTPPIPPTVTQLIKGFRPKCIHASKKKQTRDLLELRNPKSCAKTKKQRQHRYEIPVNSRISEDHFVIGILYAAEAYSDLPVVRC